MASAKSLGAEHEARRRLVFRDSHLLFRLVFAGCGKFELLCSDGLSHDGFFPEVAAATERTPRRELAAPGKLGCTPFYLLSDEAFQTHADMTSTNPMRTDRMIRLD